MKKIKLLFAVLTVAVLATVCLTINANALTEGDWEFTLLDNEVRITKYLGNAADVVIPDTIYGNPVTQVDGHDTFSKHKNSIISLTYPSTVKIVEAGICFCSNSIETVVLPEGIEEIKDNAFTECTELKNIQLPSTLKRIGNSAFRGCKSLKSINFPSGLEHIDGSTSSPVFGGCGLESIDLSQTTAVIDASTFKDCKELKNVKLNANMTKIPNGLFEGCSSLEHIDLPAGITEIEGYAFSRCESLKSIILPVSLKKIDNYSAFGYCDNLREVVIPYGTQYIGGKVFTDCVNLESVFVPSTVTKIDILNIVNDCPKAIVYCDKGSYAEEYCRKHGISYLTDSSVNSGITVLYNGTRVSFHSYGQNPELLNSRTLVPLRSIFEAMGAQVEWDDATRTAIAKRNGIEIRIGIGANEIYKNGDAIAVDVPAQILNDRTMVPARVIAEAFGASVEWNDSGKTVLITE